MSEPERPLQPPHVPHAPEIDEIDAWKDFRAQNEVGDYEPGQDELDYLYALGDAIDYRIYKPYEALRKAFDAGVLRGRIEGVALAQRLVKTALEPKE